MIATEIRFYVPRKKGGHTVVILELFPAMGNAVRPSVRSRVNGDENSPTCTVQNLHDAVVCIRAIMDRVVEYHGRADYPSTAAREEAVHAAALVLFMAMETSRTGD
jgi:hypothetical protein